MEKLLEVQDTLLEPIELDDEELAAVAGGTSLGARLEKILKSFNHNKNSLDNSFNTVIDILIYL